MTEKVVSFEGGSLTGTYGWDSAVTDSGKLACTQAAALYQAYGQAVDLSGGSNIYGSYDFGSTQTRIHGGVYIDPNDISADDGENVYVIQDSNSRLRLVIYYQDTPAYEILAGVRDNESTMHYTDVVALPNAPTWVEFDAFAGDGTGFIKLWVGSDPSGSPDEQVTSLTNDNMVWQVIYGGALSFNAENWSGTMYQDHFVFNNTGDVIGEPVGVPLFQHQYRLRRVA